MFLWLLAAMLATVAVVGDAHSIDRVRIGVSNYNLSNLTVGVAQTRDFFKQEGIDAEIIRMNPNVATMALVSGDVGYTTLIGSVIGANLNGAKLKLIACSQDRTPPGAGGQAGIQVREGPQRQNHRCRFLWFNTRHRRAHDRQAFWR